MKYSHIIWDFNGTILDDVWAGINSENVLLSRRDMPLIKSVEEYHDYFCFPIIEYYKRLGHDFERDKYEDLAVEWAEQYKIFSEDCELQAGITTALAEFERMGLTQVILSASEVSLLKNQIESFGITEYFTEILGLDNINAHSKVHLGREWMERNNPSRAVFIGDTVHDFEVAQAMGVECVLIASGHQSKMTLLECGVCVYDNILDFVEKLVNER